MAGTKLIPLDQVQTITKIPVLPISYADATPFLKSLRGELVPENWRGGLPITYKVGPSVAMAHLAVSNGCAGPPRSRGSRCKAALIC